MCKVGNSFMLGEYGFLKIEIQIKKAQGIGFITVSFTHEINMFYNQYKIKHKTLGVDVLVFFK